MQWSWRQSGPRVSSVVGPPSAQVVRWSRSLLVAGIRQPGREFKGVVCQTDLLATLAEVLGAALPDESGALRRVTLASPHLPAAWDGLTILQVADVHAAFHHTQAVSLQAADHRATGTSTERRGVHARLVVQHVAECGSQVDFQLIESNHGGRG